MRGERIKTRILSVQIIPNADPMLLAQLPVPKGHRSLGLITTDCDDVSYAALDEATKKAQVEVAYARSMYAGAANASTALAGEFIGILSAENPEEVRSGLDAAVSYIENDARFIRPTTKGPCLTLRTAFPARAAIFPNVPMSPRERPWPI